MNRCPLTGAYSLQPDRPPTKLQTSSTVHLLTSSGAMVSSPSVKSPPMAPGWEWVLLSLGLGLFQGSHLSADLPFRAVSHYRPPLDSLRGSEGMGLLPYGGI